MKFSLRALMLTLIVLLAYIPGIPKSYACWCYFGGKMVSTWLGAGDFIDSIDGNYGTGMNGAGFAPGMVGDAFSLDGINDYVMVPDAFNLEISGPITVETWIKPTDLGCSDVRPIVNKMQEIPLIGWSFDILCSSGKLRVRLFETPSTQDTLISNSTIPTNSFTHVAFTWDGAKLIIYINGNLDAQVNTSISSIGVNGSPLLIGHYATSYFKGLIDELAIYNSDLSWQEIQYIYDAGSRGKCGVPALSTYGLLILLILLTASAAIILNSKARKGRQQA